MTERNPIHPAWAELRHGGILIAPSHVRALFTTPPTPLRADLLEQLRRASSRFDAKTEDAGPTLLDTVLHRILGLGDPVRPESGNWIRGSHVGPEWSKRSITGGIL